MTCSVPGLVCFAVLTATIVGCQEHSTRRRSVASVPDCSGIKVGVLDLAEFADSADIPPCDVDTDLKVNPSNGVVYAAKFTKEFSGSHTLGTHAAPWFLSKAIRASSHYTSDWESANIVYVDDYCLYTKWLAHVHTIGREKHTTAGTALDLAYDLLLATPRWKKHWGADFVFYDAHPGFRAGPAELIVMAKYCNQFTNATIFIVDTPMRNVCPTFMDMPRVYVTPYAPNSLGNSSNDHLALPPRVLLRDRPMLLYSRARCDSYKTYNVGKSMRWYFSQHAIEREADVDVQCTNSELKGEHAPYEEMFQSMSQSKFCMAFPGDAASTRRLSEIMLSGCIPVFPGPPYHSMPFSEHIDWQAAGVFFNITEYGHWSDMKIEFRLSPEIRSAYATEARWWVPDAPVHEAFISLSTASELVPRLRRIPDAQIREKLEYVDSIRSRFMFASSFTEPPNAVDTLMSTMCQAQSADSLTW